MNVVDIIVIVLLVLGFILGYKRGLLPELVSLVSFFLIVWLAFALKNPVSQFLYTKLPFFKFGGVLKGVTIINILLYEVIAFVLLTIVFYVAFKIILAITKIFENAMEELSLLQIILKVVGGVLGVVENYILVFVIIYIVSLPFFDIDMLKESKLRSTIAYKTPVLTTYAKKTIEVGEDLWSLTDKYKTGTSANDFNLEALDLFLKYKIVTVDSIDKLVDIDKLEINNIESVLIKYRSE